MTRKIFKNYHTARNFNLIVLAVVYFFLLAVYAGLFSGCRRSDKEYAEIIVTKSYF